MQPDGPPVTNIPTQPNQPITQPTPTNPQETSPKNTSNTPNRKISKGFIITIVIVVIVVILGILAFVAWQNMRQKQIISDYESCSVATGSVIQESYPEKCVAKDGEVFVKELSKEEEQKLSPAPTSDPTENWKTYRNEGYGFEFRYPEKLNLVEEGNLVALNHSILYKNTGNCDLAGEDVSYENLEDFSISFEIVGLNKIPEYTDGNLGLGKIEGSWAYEGAEGCGEYVYYFPVEDNKTLIIRRAAIQALSGISTYWNLDEILSIDGVISPGEAKIIFNQILSTIKFLPENCGPCPAYDLPPDFCLDGELVFGPEDECGCQGPPKCVN